jgi:plasmid maintenance system killer protein
MKVILQNKDLEHIYIHGREKGSPKYPPEVVKGFIKKVNILAQAGNTQELRAFKSLHFEALKGNYEGSHSIRVNDQFRIVFKILKEEDGSTKVEVIQIDELKDYH